MALRGGLLGRKVFHSNLFVSVKGFVTPMNKATSIQRVEAHDNSGREVFVVSCRPAANRISASPSVSSLHEVIKLAHSSDGCCRLSHICHLWRECTSTIKYKCEKLTEYLSNWKIVLLPISIYIEINNTVLLTLTLLASTVVFTILLARRT